MSINSHLSNTASNLIITQSERDIIDGHLNSLKTKLNAYFEAGTFIEWFEFGSFKRKTLMPRKADSRSDVDLMLVFSNSQYQPSTYLSWLKSFAEKKYGSSEIYQSHPTIVLELSKIKIELVPAIRSAYDGYQIPAPSNNYQTWLTTHPHAFNNALTNKNTTEKSLIRPLIRIMKYWNATNDWVYSSYELENLIVNKLYLFCTTLWDYFETFVASLSTFGVPTYKANKIQRLKDKVAESKKLNAEGYPTLAENKLREVILEY